MINSNLMRILAIRNLELLNFSIPRLANFENFLALEESDELLAYQKKGLELLRLEATIAIVFIF